MSKARTAKPRRGRPKGSKTVKPAATVEEKPPACPVCGGKGLIVVGTKPRTMIDAPSQQAAHNRAGRIWRQRICSKCSVRYQSVADIPLEPKE